MDLYFKKSGSGKALIILHGLFGMGDNWATLSRGYAAKGFEVFVPDLRNHGRSPHSEKFDYESMAQDLSDFISKNGLSKASIIGHSLGGKVSMYFAALFPDQLEKLIVVDIGTKYYPPHHQGVLAAIHAVRPQELAGRKEAEARLREALSEESTIQFLLKNLYWNDNEKLEWRFNIVSIEKNIEEVGKALPDDFYISAPTLFLAGERSGYIKPEDIPGIRKHFSNVDFAIIPDAGHWVHAENPEVFFKRSLEFLQ